MLSLVLVDVDGVKAKLKTLVLAEPVLGWAAVAGSEELKKVTDGGRRAEDEKDDGPAIESAILVEVAEETKGRFAPVSPSPFSDAIVGDDVAIEKGPAMLAIRFTAVGCEGGGGWGGRDDDDKDELDHIFYDVLVVTKATAKAKNQNKRFDY